MRGQGRLAKALDTFATSLGVFREEGDLQSAAGAFNGMADASRDLCQWETAEHHFRSCLAIYEDLNDPSEGARAQVRYAMVFHDRHQAEQPCPLVNEALETFRSTSDRAGKPGHCASSRS